MINKKRNKSFEVSIFIVPATILITFMFLFPLINFLRISFNKKSPGLSMESAWVLDSYIKFFTDPYFLNILWNTIYIAFFSTLLTVLLAFPIAYTLARTKSKWKGLLVALVIFPLLVGNIVRDIGWIALFSETGLLNNVMMGMNLIDSPIQIIGTPLAVIIAITNVVLPYMIITTQSVIEQISPSLEEVAEDLGASKWNVMKTVMIPLAAPGILAGTLFVFILSLNAYTTPLIIGGSKVRMMAPTLYTQITEISDWPTGSAMAAVLIVITLASAILYLRILDKMAPDNINQGVKG